MIRIRNPQDFAAGLLFVLIGAGALWGMSDLRMGTAVRMGPAYIPTLVAYGVIGIGGLVALTALAVPGPSLERWAWGPLALICGATAFFGLTVAHIGLVLASAGLIVTACLATRGLAWWKIAIFASVMPAVAAILFNVLLGLPMRLWPW